MSTVRLRRLQADYDKLLDYVHRHPRVKLVQAQGTPPESYQLEFQLRSLRMKDDEIQVVQDHLVEIHLPRNYPRTPPQCRMLTPIFHPNIAPHAVCIGDHWSAGEPLWSIVARIGEMIAYQSYNTKSPLNGDAARWTDENLDRLPLDSTTMILDEQRTEVRWAQPTEAAEPPMAQPLRPAPAARPIRTSPPTLPQRPAAAAPPAKPAAAPAPTVNVVECPNCNAKLRLPAGKAVPRVRCPRCNSLVNIA